MAQKRMFDKAITNSDDFLEMPDSSQILYFHLSMNADDDGFINNWKSIMKMTGTKEDDLKLLIAKSYIIIFDTGVIVIRHWRINNYLRQDRYKETKYIEEKNQLTIGNNEEYILNEIIGIPVVYPDKNRIDKNNNNTLKNEIFEQRFKEFYNEYPKKVNKKETLNWFIKHKPNEELFKIIMKSLEEQKKHWKEKKYIPYPTTWLNGELWDNEIDDEDNQNDDEVKLINEGDGLFHF